MTRWDCVTLGVVHNGISVCSFASKRAVLDARIVQPAAKVVDELATFRHAVHGDAPWRVVTFIAVVTAVHAASIELGIEVLQEIIDPAGGGVCDERDVLTLTLLFQDVGDRELIASGEAGT